jgi:hypothetical protein
VDADRLIKNCNSYPFEKLQKYLGQHVAWRIDGTEIIDSDPDPVALLKRLERVDPDSYILDFIPPLREVVGPDGVGDPSDG